MRLFLLPISTRRALIYSQRVNKVPTKQLGYADRVQNYAAEKWTQWEAAEKGWQKTLTEYGNRAFQRIPYEEWGLKSIPPLSAAREKEVLAGKEKIDVQFPGNVIKKENVGVILRTLATEKQSFHEKKLRWSLIAIPFTFPFVVIPVIPNIPFFYVAFRAWSHWRALKGSKHLEFLLNHKLIAPVATPELAKVYSTSPGQKAETFTAPANPTNPKSPKTEELDIEEHMLLDHSSSKIVARSVMVPELAAEVERAVHQVQKALRAKAELAEEKRKLDKAHKPKQ